MAWTFYPLLHAIFDELSVVGFEGNELTIKLITDMCRGSIVSGAYYAVTLPGKAHWTFLNYSPNHCIQDLRCTITGFNLSQ